jgi:glycerol-3-phosphate dehydrogenase
MTEPGWVDVAGGKLTTYRLMGEQTADVVEKFLGRPARISETASQPLLTDAGAARFSGVIPPDVSREAVEHYCRNEWAVTVDDVMVRRSGWQYYVDQTAQVTSDIMKWINEAP